MAFESLINEITNRITSNGNKEVSALRVRTVLNTYLVPQLGASEFQGVATPTSSPDTLERSTFFLASQSGTYTNFLGTGASPLVISQEGLYVFSKADTGAPWTSSEVLAGQELIDAVRANLIPHFPFAISEDVSTPAGVNDWFLKIEFLFDSVENRRQLYLDRIWNGASGNWGFRVYDDVGLVCSFYSPSFTPDPSGYDELELAEWAGSGVTGKATVYWAAMAAAQYNNLGLAIDQRHYKYADLIDDAAKPLPYAENDDNGTVSSVFRAAKDAVVVFPTELDFYDTEGLRTFQITRIRRNAGSPTKFSQIHLKEKSSGTTVCLFSVEGNRSGLELVELTEQNSSGLSALVPINWDAIPDGTDTASTEKHDIRPNYRVSTYRPLKPVSSNFTPDFAQFGQFKGYGQMPENFVPFGVAPTYPNLTLENILDAVAYIRFSGVPDNVLIALDKISRDHATEGYMYRFIYLHNETTAEWREFVTISDIQVTESGAATERYTRQTFTADQMNQPPYANTLKLEIGIDYKALPDNSSLELNKNSDGDSYSLVYQIVAPNNVKKIGYPRIDSIKPYNFKP